MHHMKKFLICDINSSMIDEFKTKDGYTEYGYRGLGEIKRLQDIIEKKENELKRKNELLDKLSNELRDARHGRIKH